MTKGQLEFENRQLRDEIRMLNESVQGMIDSTSRAGKEDPEMRSFYLGANIYLGDVSLRIQHIFGCR